MRTEWSDRCEGGVLMDMNGEVAALWVRTSNGDEESSPYGLSMESITKTVQKVVSGEVPEPRVLPFECRPIRGLEVQSRGLLREWVGQIREDTSLLLVDRVHAFAGENQALHLGDINVKLEGKPATQMNDLIAAAQQESAVVRVFREGGELEQTITTVFPPSTSSAITFCGMTLHEPHYAVYQSVQKVPSKVYISFVEDGSPAALYRLPAAHFITSVNGFNTGSLDEFREAVQQGTSGFKLMLVGLQGRRECHTLWPNEYYVSWLH